MRKQKQIFDVKSADGQMRKLILYVDVISVASMANPTGEPVNYIAQGHYKLAHTGEILKSQDPLAP